MRIRTGHLAVALALFAVEVGIALWCRDRFVRPYLGDILAVAMVHFGLRGATPLKASTAGACAFTLGAAIELGQAMHVLALVGLQDSALARVVFGGVFDWTDIACYGLGAAGALTVDRLVFERSDGGANVAA
ncbi:MAG: DUF2809 domain-containing protein [Caulobacter sp.]